MSKNQIMPDNQNNDNEENLNNDVPSVNQQGRDTNSNKKLKTLGLLVIGMIVIIVGIIISANRVQKNKDERKAKEAEAIAESQKNHANGKIDVTKDQNDIQNNRLKDLPPPADLNNTDPVVQDTTPPYTPPPPQPIPNSYYDQPPQPQPLPQEPPPTYVERTSEPKAPEPEIVGSKSSVLVDTETKAAFTLLENHQNQQDKANNRNVLAKQLPNLEFSLTKGTTIPCVLKTKIDSTYQGFTVCQTSRDVYSANGKILLLERGSNVFGEQNIQIQYGQARVWVMWKRIDTPLGVSIDIDSPATGQLGEMGVGAKVNNQYAKRFGSAILLSLIQDGISAGMTHLEKQKDKDDKSTTISNTSKTAESMAEKTLEHSINIPPIATVNHGEMINILVTKDVDFSNVYGVKREY